MITFLQIEPTTRCGLSCPNCIRDKDQEIRDLSVETLERILLEYPTATTIKLQGLGEPFMHPHLDIIAATCQAKGYFVTTTTNGQSDRVVEWARHFDEIVFSLDYINPPAPEGAHQGSTQKVIESIFTIRDHHTSVRLAVNQVISANTRPRDIEEVKTFCRDYSVNYGSARIENWEAGPSSLEVELDRKRNGRLMRRSDTCPWGKTHLYFDANYYQHPCCIRMGDRYANQPRSEKICGRCPD